ncbi:MBL fold metallo-hydrolase [Phorcysia thermohydrogeniphila]|uniref:L-ascorbate metabolism protein UlaG (Beta-lactamase superfamily) n=1 Tax=Phorcysia thermohydrogeniphila TaxID=936138 RepID=A0A4R1GF26_9BACT|nr:MBL fold metallo-hydrolase [Phorcysia thermohydrogeniphila]TCK05235.1 L-ascorbate metabolism protein UlaG (beta-lactamase superfamily) [Phorcysia thermohydrogeniphila]
MGQGRIENLGHSSFLVKVGGRTILTDPFLTDSAGGIKRVVPPAKLPEELSPDVVLISHAHYDHLDLKTLRRLKGEFTVVTPERCAKVVKGREVVELADFESTEVKGIKILKVPAKHNRGRNILYPDTGVGGFVFTVEGLTFYFAGDTAFSPELYALIAERAPAIDFAMLPIGGFMPFPFRRFHQTPEEAFRGFCLLNARNLVPIHFGTWHLIPFYVKREKAVERLLSCSYICGREKGVLVIRPGEFFDI